MGVGVAGELDIILPCPRGNRLEKDPQNRESHFPLREDLVEAKATEVFHCLLWPTFWMMGLVLCCMFRKK